MRINCHLLSGGNISVTLPGDWLTKDILPENFDTPMFWNDEELTQLKGTEVLPRIGKKKSEEQYTQLLLPLITVSPILPLTQGKSGII